MEFEFMFVAFFEYALLIIITVLIPLAFTVWNIKNWIKDARKSRIAASTLTVLIGGFMYLLLLALFDCNGEWYEPIYQGQLHYPISGEYGWPVMLCFVFGFIGLFTLIYFVPEKLPPLITVMSTALVILLNVAGIAFAVQLTNQFSTPFDFLFYLYHFNILILSVDAVRSCIKAQSKYFSSRKDDFEDRKNLMWLYMKVQRASQYSLPIFLALFFFVALIEIMAVLAGQGLDAPLKAFTDTADWTFSQQIPPPPMEYEGHYLCTVAAGGHKNLVKPVRYGKRRGAIIVVNRQLCIANAFEESVAERFPRFHRWIRHVYDTYGYPLSNIITTPGRADLIYILMKPLEWVFLLYLYLTDTRPEVRINRQYKM
ncbi:MAG: hypothetical protein IJR15_05300 [Clostridiales bacterium]|nr:hypothetical protein [Clostridiales bacterium]